MIMVEDDPGTESSTPRSQKPSEPALPPAVLRPRIRPGFDLIRRPDDPNQWMEHMLEVSMGMVEYIIQGEETKWMTTPPPVQGFDSPHEAVDLWVVPKENEYDRIITRIHHRWRENAFHPDHPTLPKNLDQLYKHRITFLWNDLKSEERKVILAYNWEERWVEEKWVGYTVFLVKTAGEMKAEKALSKK